MPRSPSAASTRGTPARRGRSPRTSIGTPAANTAPDVLPFAPASPTTSTAPKPIPTFTSCLSIPVEGAVPIARPVQAPPPPARAQTPTDEPRRAPRKSKVEALAALQNHASASALDDIPQGAVPGFVRPDVGPIPVTPALDLDTVKTTPPREVQRPSGPRPFELADCPEFYPTPEEFKDPMAYIKKISETACDYGMCKIVPPEDWHMPFVTDTENFRFTTRLQRLNSIEASSRAKVNYLEQLYRFHQQQGNTRVSVPTINNKPLDLWLLRKEVKKLGGHEAVTKTKKWGDLGRLLGYGGIPGLSTQIKNSYTRVILPYETFCERVRNSPALANATANASANTQIRTLARRRQSMSVSLEPEGSGARQDSPPSSPLTATSSPLSEPPEEAEVKDVLGSERGSGRRRLPRRSISDATPHKDEVKKARTNGASWKTAAQKNEEGPGEQPCEICHKGHRGEEMLLCDGCDCGFHMFCLDPPLASVPKGQWYCHTCLFGTGGDFGFDEGEEHSLSSFQARDREFRRLWFETHPPPKMGKEGVSEYDVEEEFWRLVQSASDTVEIEYGADVHSTTHGSAMPTLETHPLNPYSKDPWNLNNVPILSESLLRYIKSDISGMTVPWTYVGMVFSTFCWHNEDHYTYSINYMHWGEAKTWYGIPGADADKFEAAIRREAPDLFEAQPDLLFQLVTLMNPKRLTEAGVNVYACNQRAGEFVITYPKAYHAGFNHGLNFNEAVNFALPDWLPYGRQCVQRYRDHRKHPVFSHDELLITITQQSQSIATAIWLNDSLKEMTDRELGDRRKARALKMGEVLEHEDRPEDMYQCHTCKAFCYLSQVTCACTTKIACVDHASQLCDCAMEQRVLRKRFSDEELVETQSRVAERAAIPTAWQAKLRKALAESARPQLRTLRALLAEGDRINHPLPELRMIRKCVARANDWIDAAQGFIVRKQSRKRSKRPRGRPPLSEQSTSAIEDPGERPDKGLEDLYALLKEVEGLGFDCSEITTLKDAAAKAEELKVGAHTLLSSVPSDRDREAYVRDCERLLLEGSSVNVYIEELAEVEKLVAREQLIRELENDVDDSTMTLDDVNDYLVRARGCNLGAENTHVKLLEARQRAGQTWDERAKHVLAQAYKTLDELDEFGDIDSSVPIDPTILDKVGAARAKAKEFEKQAKTWLVPEQGAVRPRVQDVMRFVTRAEKEFSIPAVRELKRMADFALDLESRCDQVLKNRFEHQDEEEDVFAVMLKWVDYAKQHLSVFTLPKFEKLDQQLTLHYRWIESLPWYCTQHRAAHGAGLYEDVIAATRPEDDMPPEDEYFTCICDDAVRPPAPGTNSDAVQCDHCFARFHGQCARSGGSCPFCDHHHWNGSIHKERSWHFCFMPTMLVYAPDVTKNYSEDWKQLELIVHRVDRLAAVIGQFLSFASQPGNQRREYISQVRHYMRKLYKIQFAVSPNPEVSFGLDLAGLHRIIAGQPTAVRTKKRRRPKFIFGQDIDGDWVDGTRCICRGRTPYLVNYPAVTCTLCHKKYHGGCVFFPIDPTTFDNRFTCPLCCLRKNRRYEYAELRVKNIDETDVETYVDTVKMLETFSKNIIFKKLPPPYTQTLFVELVKFTAGQPDAVSINGAMHPSTSSPTNHATNGAPHAPRRSHTSPHVQPPPPAMSAPSYDSSRSASVPGHHMPPPPPWANKWSNHAASTASTSTPAPPSRTPTTPLLEAHRVPITTPPSASRKRKFADSSEPADPPIDPAVLDSPGPAPSWPTPPGKRRTMSRTPAPESTGPSHSHAAPSRPIQTLSPSLAMIMSPDSRHSPRQPVYAPMPGPSTMSRAPSTSPPPGHGARKAAKPPSASGSTYFDPLRPRRVSDARLPPIAGPEGASSVPPPPL